MVIRNAVFEKLRSVILIGIITTNSFIYGGTDILLITDLNDRKSYCISQNNNALQFDGVDEESSRISSGYIPDSKGVYLKSPDVQLKNQNQIDIAPIYDKRWENFPINCNTKFQWKIEPNETNMIMLIKSKTDLFIGMPGYDLVIKISDNENENKWNYLFMNLTEPSVKWNDLTIGSQHKYQQDNIIIIKKDQRKNEVSLEGNGTMFCVKTPQYECLWSKGKSIRQTEIGAINKTKEYFCLATYLSACENCSILISLIAEESGLRNETDFKGQGKKWDEVRTIIYSTEAETVKMYVRFTVTNSSEEPYWAIDTRARQCDLNEYRYINMSGSSANGCSHLISSDAKIAIIPTKNNNLPVCQNKRIGSNGTIDYNLLGSTGFNLNNRRICKQSNVERYKTECCCFNSWGEKCEHSCNAIKSVNLTEVNKTWAQLTIALTTEQETDYDVIVYVKADNIWKQYNKTKHLSVLIQNLTIATEHHVKVKFVPEKDGNSVCNDTKFVRFTTSCTDITSEQLSIEVTNTTACFKLKTVILDACPLKKYCEGLINNNKCNVTDNALKLYFLIPFKNYSIEMNNNITNFVLRLNFTTKQGRATTIRNFTATPGNTNIHVKWRKPNSLGGTLKKYKIYIKQHNCVDDVMFERTMETNKNEINISELYPGVKYKFIILAVNDGELDGESFSEESTTKDDEKFDKSFDVPTKWTITQEALRITENCPTRRTKYCMTIQCLSELCKQEAIIKPDCSSKTTQNLPPLRPFTNYSVALFVRRGTTDHIISSNSSLSTRVAAPKDLKPTDIIVYSKSVKGIQIKVLKPNPPQGILQDYRVKYGNDSEEFNVTQCQFWKEYNCINIENNLKPHFNYNLKISSRNMNTNYSNETMISVNTSESKSEAPLNLSVEWVNGTMLVRWMYPNITNGPLQHFEIKVSYENTTLIKKSIGGQLENEIQISELLKCDVYYNVEVYGVNGYGNGFSSTSGIVRPPIIVEWLLWDNSTEFDVHSALDRVKYSSLYVLSINQDIVEKNITNSTVKKILTYAMEDTNNYTFVKKMQAFDLFNKEEVLNCTKLLFVFVDGCDEFKMEDVQKSVFIWYLLIVIIVITIFTFALIIWYRQKKLQNKIPDTGNVMPLLDKRKDEDDIQLTEYEEYLKNVDKRKLEKSFQNVPLKDSKLCHIGRLPENKEKNRYPTIVPYDDSRVVLEWENNDYINASHVLYAENDIIAAQGPQSDTETDFWYMVWQESVSQIIMITCVQENGLDKCSKYWPEINKTKKYANIIVECMSEIYYMDYVERTFTINNLSKLRQIAHMQYFSWKENSLPNYLYSLLPILEKIVNDKKQKTIIHSSRGTGRTGTLLLCYYMLQQRQYGVLNFRKGLSQIRSWRCHSINDFTHYKLAHILVHEYIYRSTRSSEIPYDNDFLAPLDLQLQDNGIDRIFAIYKSTEWCQSYFINQDVTAKYYTALNFRCYFGKFIIAKSNSNVWDIISEKQVTSVFKINGGILLKPNYIQMSSNHGVYALREGSFNKKPLKIYSFGHWGEEEKKPKIKEFVEFVQLLASHDEKERVLICCSDGLAASLLFVGFYLIIERMRLDKLCNVVAVFHYLKMININFKIKKEHFELIYELIREYVKSNKHL